MFVTSEWCSGVCTASAGLRSNAYLEYMSCALVDTFNCADGMMLRACGLLERRWRRGCQPQPASPPRLVCPLVRNSENCRPLLTPMPHSCGRNIRFLKCGTPTVGACALWHLPRGRRAPGGLPSGRRADLHITWIVVVLPRCCGSSCSSASYRSGACPAPRPFHLPRDAAETPKRGPRAAYGTVSRGKAADGVLCPTAPPRTPIGRTRLTCGAAGRFEQGTDDIASKDAAYI